MSDTPVIEAPKTKPEPAKPSTEKRALLPLRPGDVMTQSHAFQLMNADIPVGVMVEDLTNPALWTNVASKLQPGAEIRCIAEDMSFRALVFVRYKNGHHLSVELLESKTFKGVGQDAIPSSEYTVEYINNRYKWGFKDRDGNWVRKDITSEAQAYKERDEHIKAMRN